MPPILAFMLATGGDPRQSNARLSALGSLKRGQLAWLKLTDPIRPHARERYSAVSASSICACGSTRSLVSTR